MVNSAFRRSMESRGGGDGTAQFPLRPQQARLPLREGFRYVASMLAFFDFARGSGRAPPGPAGAPEIRRDARTTGDACAACRNLVRYG